jgi:hypothetical protein
MSKIILSFVAKSRKDVVIDEIRHYFRSSQYFKPKTQGLIQKLVRDELMRDYYARIPPEFFLAMSQPCDNVDIDVTCDNRSGTSIKVVFNYFWTRKNSGTKDYVGIEISLRRKRTYEENITFLMPPNWKTTPLCGMYVFSDTSIFSRGKLIRTPNPVTGVLVRALLARLPKRMEDVIRQALKSNKWSNTQDVCAKILQFEHVLKRHKRRARYQILVNVASQLGDIITFRKYLTA